MIVLRLRPKRSRSTAIDQLLAVAGSCLPMSFVRDNNIKRWVNYIAPEVPLIEIIFTHCEFIFSVQIASCQEARP